MLIVAELPGKTNSLWEAKTCLINYQIQNKLISYYPGIANLSRKGINKEVNL